MSSDLAGEAGLPIERKHCVEYFRNASAAQTRRIGLEYELLPVDAATGNAVPFEGPGARSVQTAFLGLLELPGYRAVEGPKPPSTLGRGGASINLEPGAQTELSGAPFEKLAEVEQELREVLADFESRASACGFVYLSHGLQPVSLASDIEMVPKRRYAIMAEHFARHGGPRYRDMMTRTASVQVSFDFTCEADAGRKLKLAMLAAPVASAIFANSPVAGGRESGSMSERVAIWRQVDGVRTGLVPAAVDGEWSFERYVDHLLLVPAIVVRAPDGGVEPAGGVSFGELLQRGVHGRRLTMADWELHLSTLFTEARLKKVLEVRSCDAPPPAAAMAMPALWTGLLYHRPSLDAALELLTPHRKEWDEWNTLASRHGLRGKAASGVALVDVARELAAASRAGLSARGLGEERYLEPLDDWLSAGRSPAEAALAEFRSGGGEAAGGVRALVEAARLRRPAR